MYEGIRSAAEIGIVAVAPVFAGGREDVEGDAFFEGSHFVRGVGRDEEAFAGVQDFFVVVEGKAELAGFEIRDLLVVVTVARNDGAFAEVDAGDGGLGTVDDLAGESGAELLLFHLVPFIERHRPP